MRKRKNGYILLTLLVVSGLAGIPSGNTIKGKERKFAAEIMKDGRSEVLKNIKTLSATQLNFRPEKHSLNIKECVYQIAFAEVNLGRLLETTMKSPANRGMREAIDVTDEQLIEIAGNPNPENLIKGNMTPGNHEFKSVEQALNIFKSKRAEHIKYIKYTTEDLRNHVVQTSIGWLDGYQLCLLIAAQTNNYISLIAEIKAHPGFPKQ